MLAPLLQPLFVPLSAAPLALTQGAGGFDWYVDSVAGNDNNAGTLAAPFATITKAMSVATSAKKRIALKRGATFRETATIPLDGMQVDAYGAGARPIVNGANLIQTSWTQTTTGSGSVTRANMRLSSVNGAAFIDFGAANVLTTHLGELLTITDSAGKKLTGYIKAAGTGETFGSELLANTDFAATTGVSVWYNTTLSSVAGGQSGNCLRVTQTGGGFGFAYQPFTAVAGAAYKTSAYLQKGTETGQMALAVLVGGTHAPIASVGALPATFTQSNIYFTAAGTSYEQGYTANTDATYSQFDTASAKQVLTPSATGVTITSTSGGATFNWASQDAGFNYNDSSGYTYSTGAAVGNVWQTTLATQPYVVAINGTPSIAVADLASVNGAGKWFWGSNTLYVYSTSDPATAFTTPGVEASFRTNCVNLNSKNNVNVRNIEAKYSRGEGFANGGAANGSGVVVDGCNMVWNGGAGIFADTSAASWLLLNNYLRYNGGKALGLSSNDNMTIYGTGHVIAGNDSSYAYGDGIYLGGSGHTIRNNEFSYNGNSAYGYGIELICSTTDVYFNSVKGNISDYAGIELFGGDGNKVHHNLVVANAGNGIALSSGISEVTYNVVYGHLSVNGFGILLAGGGNGSLVANNTSVGNLVGIEVYSETTTGLIKNNIVASNTQIGISYAGGGVAAATIANNDVWGNGGGGTTNYYNLSSQTGINGNISVDPKFTNAGSQDYSLQATSPCADAGANLGVSYKPAIAANSNWPSSVSLIDQGTLWDIGAYAR